MLSSRRGQCRIGVGLCRCLVLELMLKKEVSGSADCLVLELMLKKVWGSADCWVPELMLKKALMTPRMYLRCEKPPATCYTF